MEENKFSDFYGWLRALELCGQCYPGFGATLVTGGFSVSTLENSIKIHKVTAESYVVPAIRCLESYSLSY